ncbi:hypothetical protein Egran_06782, partial [Elaphomyces granulatus]
MNLHHPIWGGEDAEEEPPEADELIHLMDEARLQLLTESGTVTWSRGEQRTTVDLTFVSQTLSERLIVNEVAEDVSDDSDHHPIRTVIDTTTVAGEPPKRRNFKLMDTKKLVEH